MVVSSVVEEEEVEVDVVVDVVHVTLVEETSVIVEVEVSVSEIPEPDPSSSWLLQTITLTSSVSEQYFGLLRAMILYSPSNCGVYFTIPSRSVSSSSSGFVDLSSW